MPQIYGQPVTLQVPHGHGAGGGGGGGGGHDMSSHVGHSHGSMGGHLSELSKTNLYIKGLTENTTDRDLYNLCTQYGTIISTKAILNKDTQKCKGYGFVDFNTASEAESAVKALVAQGVQAQMAKVSPSQSPNSQIEPDPTNLYIANLPAHMSETDLENLLSAHGSVVSTRILRDVNMQSRGVGFARMESKEKCEHIIHLFHGKKLSGCSEGLLVKFADGANKKRLQQHVMHGYGGHGGPMGHHGGHLGHHGGQHNGSGPGHHDLKGSAGGHHSHHMGHHNGAASGQQGEHGGHGRQWGHRGADDANALYGADGMVSQHSPIGIVPAGFHVSQGRAAYGAPHPQLSGGTLQLGGALQYAMQANGIYGDPALLSAYMAGQQQPPAPAQYIIHSGPHSGPHGPHGPGHPHAGFGPTAAIDGATLYAHVGALGPAQLAQQMQQLQIGSPHAGAAGHHLVQHYNAAAGQYMAAAAAMLPSMQGSTTNGTDVGGSSVDSGVGGDPQPESAQQQAFSSATGNQSSNQYPSVNSTANGASIAGGPPGGQGAQAHK